MKKFLSIMNPIFMVMGYMISNIGVGLMTEIHAVLAISVIIVGLVIMIGGLVLFVTE